MLPLPRHYAKLSIPFLLLASLLLFTVTQMSNPGYLGVRLPPPLDISDIQDYFNMTPKELNRFMLYKEEQYRQRRERIYEKCRIITAVAEGQKLTALTKPFKNSLIYAKKFELMYCQIAKTGSSTWCKHFIDLAGVSESEKKRHSQALQLYAPKLWPMPNNTSWKSAANDINTTMVITRHPFSRLASVYYEKMIKNRKAWKGMVETIIRKYRPAGSHPPHPEYPTPEEYLKYIINDIANNKNPNDHWRPVSFSCPFCSHNFTVIAKLEEVAEDTAFILNRSNLTSTGLINPRLHNNPSQNSLHSNAGEINFWTNVTASTILKAYRAYRIDFEMFDYSVRGYLDSVGLTEKAEAAFKAENLAFPVN